MDNSSSVHTPHQNLSLLRLTNPQNPLLCVKYNKTTGIGVRHLSLYVDYYKKNSVVMLMFQELMTLRGDIFCLL